MAASVATLFFYSTFPLRRSSTMLDYVPRRRSSTMLDELPRDGS